MRGFSGRWGREGEKMTLEETNKRIAELFEEWKGLQPLKAEDAERFNRKVQLEWNYNSNHIEGNTLTYNETELLLIHGRVAGDHTMRDYEEMKAHNVAIDKVKEISKDTQRRLTEADIRDLNKIILKEPFIGKAQTLDGKPSQKEIIPGQYKKLPNSVKTATGEVFKFAEPEEVPAKMEELMKWFNENINSTQSISSFLAELHHRFILIHPFDDGNGRVVRLLMNYVLLRLGYPSLVIKSEDKEKYLAALQKADVGDMNALATYLGNVLVFWLQTGVKAAKGEKIKEFGDVDKEWANFSNKQKAKGLRILMSSKNAETTYNNCFKILFEKFTKEFNQYSEVFHESNLTIALQPLYIDKEKIDMKVQVNQLMVVLAGIVEHFTAKKIVIASSQIGNAEQWKEQTKNIITNESWNFSEDTTKYMILVFDYKRYTGQCEDSFDMQSVLFTDIGEFQYKTTIATETKGVAKGDISKETEEKTKTYNQIWQAKEIDEFFAKGKENFLATLKEATEKQGSDY